MRGFKIKFTIQQIVLLFSTVFFLPHTLAESTHFPAGVSAVTIPEVAGVRTNLLKNITPIIKRSIADGRYPGAIVLVSHRGRIIYRGIFGNRRIVPNVAPMSLNTIFDVASLTKVIATTPAIMQLVEKGKIDLDASVAKYWPEFATHDKEAVTIRELLTHTSGLPPEIAAGHGQAEILQKVVKLKLTHPAGTTYLYSDVNFVVLAHLVERISHQSFNEYVQEHIFKVLGMNDTLFNPPEKLNVRIAPTEIIEKKLRWGVVQDPMAHAMGGVSGNAGIFSTAIDLGIYAQCLLNGGKIPIATKNQLPTGYLLGPLTILKMTTPQTLAALPGARGLGWDIDSPYSSRGVLLPLRSFGHTGWTGTSLWIDPVTQTWIIVLTSRTHPVISGNNQVVQDRRAIANIVAGSITDVSVMNQNNTGQGELTRAYPKGKD